MNMFVWMALFGLPMNPFNADKLTRQVNESRKNALENQLIENY